MDRLVISPEPFIQKCKSLARAKNPFLDVVDGRVRLTWIVGSDGSIDFMERADAIGLGISYDMFLDALSEAGGESSNPLARETMPSSSWSGTTSTTT